MQFLNHQETVSNVETLKACFILTTSGRLETRTIKHALVAFTLMERYLIHFEDNYRQMYTQAFLQLARDNGDQGLSFGQSQGRTGSPAKASGKMAHDSGMLQPFNNERSFSSPGKLSMGSSPVPQKAKSGAWNPAKGKSYSQSHNEVDLICACRPDQKIRA